MRILVCGGRRFGDARLFARAMEPYRKPGTIIIQGGADGADSMASFWARQHGLEGKTFHADWKTHGKAAGPIRNQRMLDEGKPDLVVAFPGGTGTADMVARAKRAGVNVIEVAACR